MPSPKVIIHRLDAPWLRDSRRAHRRRFRRALLTTVGAAAGFTMLIAALSVTGETDTAPPPPATRHSFTQN